MGTASDQRCLRINAAPPPANNNTHPATVPQLSSPPPLSFSLSLSLSLSLSVSLSLSLPLRLSCSPSYYRCCLFSFNGGAMFPVSEGNISLAHIFGCSEIAFP